MLFLFLLSSVPFGHSTYPGHSGVDRTEEVGPYEFCPGDERGSSFVIDALRLTAGDAYISSRALTRTIVSVPTAPWSWRFLAIASMDPGRVAAGPRSVQPLHRLSRPAADRS